MIDSAPCVHCGRRIDLRTIRDQAQGDLLRELRDAREEIDRLRAGSGEGREQFNAGLEAAAHEVDKLAQLETFRRGQWRMRHKETRAERCDIRANVLQRAAQNIRALRQGDAEGKR